MNKIFIVGIVASGKTTLAKRLSAQLGIPWYELDAVIYEGTGDARTKRTPEEQAEAIRAESRPGIRQPSGLANATAGPGRKIDQHSKKWGVL